LTDRRISFYVEDMLDAIEKIRLYIGTMDYEAFKSDNLIVDAVIRNLEVIGEAAKRIPDKVREKYPDMQWKSIVGLRNAVLHEYLGIDRSIIYKIVTEDFQKTEVELKKCLTYLQSTE